MFNYDNIKELWIKKASEASGRNIDDINICEYETIEDLTKKLEGNYWAAGEAFIYKDLCFINQIEGGNEMMLYKGPIFIDSISCARFIKEDKHKFKKYVNEKLN